MTFDSTGEAHFNSSQAPLLYFTVLLLSQQFEAVSHHTLQPVPCSLCVCLADPGPSLLPSSHCQAIEFLSRVELLHSHAVHFAIALQELQLLHLTESARAKLRECPSPQCTAPPHSVCTTSSVPSPAAVVRDPDGLRRLNFARLVISYTRRFSLTDPREALHYFFLLKVQNRQLQDCSSPYLHSHVPVPMFPFPFPGSSLQGMEGGEGQDVFSSCVADLVMESREFEMLLGRIQPDGSRKPGAVDKFLRDSSGLTGFVASQAEAQGLYEDAVQLYDLSKVRVQELGP